jgi:lysophospholipase L1-like esterase
MKLILCAMSLAACATTAAAAEPPADKPVLIRNGGMTQGGPVPGDWTGKFGDADVSRDTATFKEAPASLKVTTTAGKSGQAFQTFDARAGQTLTVTGWVRSAGKVKVNVAIQSFDAKVTRNDFKQLKFVQGDTDWQPFESEVTLPAWAEKFHLVLMTEGEGSAWLDEVRDARLAVDPGRPVDLLVTSPPAKDKPWVAGWGFYPAFPTAWKLHFESQLQRTREGVAKNDIDLVFLGDSITQGWGDANGGKAVWDKTYAPLKAVNYGIGGDSTRQVLYRLDHGLLDGLKPKLVVLKIGTNNLYNDHNAGTDDEIARGIEAVVANLRKRLPDTKILLLGVLPRQNEHFSGRARNINALISKLADTKTVRYLDMTDAFQTAPGKIKPELYTKDQLHLAEPGYATWAAQIAPALAEMLK